MSNLSMCMCMEVMTIVGPLYQATFRCAGSTGFYAFEELVALDNSPIVPKYVTLDKSGRLVYGVKHYNSLDSVADVMLEVSFPSNPISSSSLPSPPPLSSYSAPLSPWYDKPFGDATAASLRRQQCFTVHYCQVALDRFGLEVPYEWYKLPWERIVFDLGGGVPTPFMPPTTPNTITVIPDYTFNSTNAQIILFKNLRNNVPHLQQTTTGSIGVEGCGNGDVGSKHQILSVVIGSRFLAENSQLSEVQFVECSIRGVTKIDPEFMSNCTRLTNVDNVLLAIGGDMSLLEIGRHFLTGCERLESVNLSVLGSITSIPHSFMMGCKSLRSLDITPLRNVTSIGDFFLHGCEMLQHIDLRTLRSVTSIGCAFMGSCWKLHSDVGSGLTHFTSLVTIGDNFMEHCVSMDRVDLSGFGKVESIGRHFLRGCKGLRGCVVDLSPLGRIGASSIGSGFLKDCTGLTDVDLSPIAHAL